MCKTGEYFPCLNFAESTIYSISTKLLIDNNANVLCPAPQIAIFLFWSLYFFTKDFNSVLRLSISAIPELKLIIEALLGSLPSGYSMLTNEGSFDPGTKDFMIMVQHDSSGRKMGLKVLQGY